MHMYKLLGSQKFFFVFYEHFNKCSCSTFVHCTPPFLMKRAAGAAALEELEIPHYFQQPLMVSLAAHHNRDQARSEM